MIELNKEFLVNRYGDRLKELTRIDLISSRISKIESSAFKDLSKLETIWLQDNEIEEIESKSFESLSSLKILWLNNNQVKGVDSVTFEGLGKLETLYLSNNGLEEIDESSFQSLSNLKYLWLSNNQLTRLHPNTFKGLFKLESLWLYDNRIAEIDGNLLKGLSNLKEIYLYNNKLEQIDSGAFKGLTKLETLSLRDNKIRGEVDATLFEDLSKLKTLWLNNNRLEKIDSKAFRVLTKLETLSLSENELTRLEDGVFSSLSNLKELELSNNRLKKIDLNALKGLTRLETIKLQANQLKEIDARSFNELSSLKLLLLNDNKLRRIDSETIEGLSSRKLETIWLQNNVLEEVDSSSFEKLVQLKEIRLDDNKLKLIDSDTFNGLVKLERIRLDANEIAAIDKYAFESLKSLKELSLSFNKLKRIDSNIFTVLVSLETLDLSNNLLDEIDVAGFEQLSSLRYLRLNNNRLKTIGLRTIYSGLVETRLEVLSLNNNEIEYLDSNFFIVIGSNISMLDLSNNKLKRIDREFFLLFSEIEVLLLYENDFQALSFLMPSTNYSYNKEKLDQNGYVADWEVFLEQFSRNKSMIYSYFDDEDSSEIKKEDLDEMENWVNEQFDKKEADLNSLRPDQILFRDPYIGKRFNDRYEVVRKLGKGSFGNVYLVHDINIETKKIKEKAMKIMEKFDDMSENELEMLWENIHDNIVRYFDHFYLKIGDDDSQMFLITEYCANGDLKNRIEEAKRLGSKLDEEQILEWMCQATSALVYLHLKKPESIIHRDIKPANMLLTRRNKIKIADLGLAMLMSKSYASTHVGTHKYMSPEVFKAQFIKINYYPNTDIWSLGCVLYELVFLKYAFPRGQFDDPPIPDDIAKSGRFLNILPMMLEKDCSVRITSKKLMIELESLLDDDD